LRYWVFEAGENYIARGAHQMLLRLSNKGIPEKRIPLGRFRRRSENINKIYFEIK
jgi:hypothetical protein